MSSLLLFNRVYLEIQYFRPSFVNYCPSNLLSRSLVIWFFGVMGVGGGCYNVRKYAIFSADDAANGFTRHTFRSKKIMKLN
jgi:hypothetical protein